MVSFELLFCILIIWYKELLISLHLFQWYTEGSGLLLSWIGSLTSVIDAI